LKVDAIQANGAAFLCFLLSPSPALMLLKLLLSGVGVEKLRDWLDFYAVSLVGASVLIV